MYMTHYSDRHMTSITQIPGVYVGHATNTTGATGCTVVVCPQGAVGGVDVRGGAPASRETDLLRPEETVSTVDAVVLAGGSAFGLAASCGVADELERRGIGVEVGVGVVPIVSSACLFDLACGDSRVRPTAADGVAAVRDAFRNGDTPLMRGNVGAGTGCTVGKIAGPSRCIKSGLGEGFAAAGDLICAAISAVNAVGDIWDPETNTPLAGVLTEDGYLCAATVTMLLAQHEESDFARSHSASRVHTNARTNTTISCVVTNARLTKAQATKVAQMSADAYAHTIRPTHTTNDGDTVFVLATGEQDAPIDVVGVLATGALERAIVDAARSARSAFGFRAAQDVERF
jgi:L-aminopeptidase/D-esterase-like protein